MALAVRDWALGRALSLCSRASDYNRCLPEGTSLAEPVKLTAAAKAAG
jgi:hypothetical protein